MLTIGYDTIAAACVGYDVTVTESLQSCVIFLMWVVSLQNPTVYPARDRQGLSDTMLQTNQWYKIRATGYAMLWYQLTRGVMVTTLPHTAAPVSRAMAVCASDRLWNSPTLQAQHTAEICSQWVPVTHS